MNKETGLDLEKLRQKVPRAWDFIFDLDMTKHRDDAVSIMQEKVKNGQTGSSCVLAYTVHVENK